MTQDPLAAVIAEAAKQYEAATTERELREGCAFIAAAVRDWIRRQRPKDKKIGNGAWLSDRRAKEAWNAALADFARAMEVDDVHAG
jgi:hypothetical protein